MPNPLKDRRSPTAPLPGVSTDLPGSLTGRQEKAPSQANPLRWLVRLVLALGVVSVALLLFFDLRVANIPKGEPFLVARVKSDAGHVELDAKVRKYGDKDRQELVGLTNAYRAKGSLSQLKRDKALDASAMAHAKDMYERGYFSHTDPDGKTPYDRLNDLSWSKVGENILQGNTVNVLTPAAALQGWKDSPPHKEALDNPAWQRVGIGVYQGERTSESGTKENFVIWVQLFGARR